MKYISSMQEQMAEIDRKRKQRIQTIWTIVMVLLILVLLIWLSVKNQQALAVCREKYDEITCNLYLE